MNPQMLQILRESRGMSSSKLAEAVGISPATMSKIEHGLVSVEEERAEKIANALNYPREVFSWSDEVHGFGSSVFYHRKQQSLTQAALRKIQAQVNLARMRLTRLMRSVAFDARYVIPTLDVSEIGGAAEAARAVRAYWALPMGPIRNMAQTLERAGVVLVRTDFETQKISAISIPPLDGAPHMIFMNSAHSADRERFTLAHELGHFVLHGDLDTPETAEREADEFASEFLMPAAEIRTSLRGVTLQSAAQLKRLWRVSIAALLRRARDLGSIDESRYKSLNVQISQRGWRKIEPVTIERDEPSVVQSLIDIQMGEHELSATELSNIVGLSEEEFSVRFNVPLERTTATRHLRLL